MSNIQGRHHQIHTPTILCKCREKDWKNIQDNVHKEKTLRSGLWVIFLLLSNLIFPFLK
jgi:hypothetical protein